jgi:hypothetical protein
VRKAKVFLCEQHKQWAAERGLKATDADMWVRRERTGVHVDPDAQPKANTRADIAELSEDGAHGFRWGSGNPDWTDKPDPDLEYMPSGTKHGYDKQVEQQAAELLKS